MEFGAIGLHETKSMVFALINNNPVEVRLRTWGCNISKAYVELIGIEEGNVTVITHKAEYSNTNKKDVSVYD